LRTNNKLRFVFIESFLFCVACTCVLARCFCIYFALRLSVYFFHFRCPKVSTLLLDEDRRLLLLQNAPQLLNNGAGKGGLGAPPLPVSTASANTWLYAGAQVTWRGADQDLPEGTVHTCVDVK